MAYAAIYLNFNGNAEEASTDRFDICWMFNLMK